MRCTTYFIIYDAFSLYVQRFLFAVKKKRNNLKQIAIDKGHVFTGKLLKTKQIKRNDPSRNEYDYLILDVAIYEYKGKKYKSKLCMKNSSWPDEIELYYIKNPKKATTSGNLGETELNSGNFFRTLFIINVSSITAVRRLLPRTSFGERKFFTI